MTGIFVGELDGELVGSISAVAYNDSFGFIGLYIVKPEFRGKGIGTRLWGAGMAYLNDHNIGLDDVVAQQPYYNRYGFRTAYHKPTIRECGWWDHARRSGGHIRSAIRGTARI